MARRSERTPADTLRRVLGSHGPALDAIRYQCEGDDPRVLVDIPDGVEPQTFGAADVDSLGCCYDIDGEEGDHYAVLVVVVKARTADLAMNNLVTNVAQVASALFADDGGGE